MTSLLMTTAELFILLRPSNVELKTSFPVSEHGLEPAGPVVVIDEGAADHGLLLLLGLIYQDNVSHLQQPFSHLNTVVFIR